MRRARFTILGFDGPFVLKCLGALLVAAFAIWAVATIAGGGNGSASKPDSTAADADDHTIPSGSAHGMPNYNQFDWDYLSRDEHGRFVYSSEEGATSKFGIDVCDHNGKIDWESVREDGVDFAILRIGARGTTEGGIMADEDFRGYFEGARAAGILTGVYFYSQAVSEEEAREEARYVIDTLAGETLDYPVAYDLERTAQRSTRADGIGGEQATACARAFCQAVADAGYTPMVYANSFDLERYDVDALYDYPLWYASYNELPFDYPPSGFAIWQYSSKGELDGIEGQIDLNIQILPEG